MLRVVCPECLEHTRCAGPVFQLDQGGGGIVFGGRENRGSRRGSADTQEVLGGSQVIFRATGHITLLIDGTGQIVDQVRAILGIHRCHAECFAVARFRFYVGFGIEGGVCHQQPGGATNFVFCSGEFLQQHPTVLDGFRKALQLVQVVHRTQQDLRRLAVCGEGFCKRQGGTDDLFLDRGLLRGAARAEIVLQVLAVSKHRSVAGFAGIFVDRVPRVLIRGALVFLGGIKEILVLQHQACQLVVDLRRFRLIREGLQVATIPVDRLCIIFAALLGELLIFGLHVLVSRVVVARQVDQVGLQELHHGGVFLDLKHGPVLRIQGVGIGKLFFRFQHQAWETALLVYLDHADGEVRRNPVQRIALDEGVVGLRRILVTALVEIVLTQVTVNVGLVIPRALAGEVVDNRFRPAQVGETQADNAEGILDMLAFGFVALLFEVVALGHLVVEHVHEIVQCHLVHVLLEQGPAALVQRELVEAGALAHIDDASVGLFGVEVFFAGKVIFPEAEEGFVQMTGGRVLGHQLTQDGHRLIDLTGFFIGPGQLVHHLVVALVQRVLHQQLFIQGNGLAGIGREQCIRIIPGQAAADVGALDFRGCRCARFEIGLAFTAGTGNAVECRIRGLGGSSYSCRLWRVEFSLAGNCLA